MWRPLLYGWQIASNLLFGSTTIYQTDPIPRPYIEPQDTVELALGATERAIVVGWDTTLGCYTTERVITNTWTNVLTTVTNIPSPGVTNIVTGTNVAFHQYSRDFSKTISWSISHSTLRLVDLLVCYQISAFYDPDTVPDNPTRWTITNLFSKLGIGDHTNSLTYIPYDPSIGLTNPASYADVRLAGYDTTIPAHIYAVNLQERYKILNALRITDFNLSQQVHFDGSSKYVLGTNLAFICTNGYNIGFHSTTDYNQVSALFSTAGWTSGVSDAQMAVPGAYFDGDGAPPLAISRAKGALDFALTNTRVDTNITVLNTWLWAEWDSTGLFFSEGGRTNGERVLLSTLSGGFPQYYTSPTFADFSTPVPMYTNFDTGVHFEDTPAPPGNVYAVYGYRVNPYALIEWQFQYCKTKYW